MVTTLIAHASSSGVWVSTPQYCAVAVRTESERIRVRSFRLEDADRRRRWLRRPGVRGAVRLVRFITDSIEAISFSFESDRGNLGSRTLVASMLAAVFVGMLLFVALPKVLLDPVAEVLSFDLLTRAWTMGLIKAGVFVVYLKVVGRLPEISDYLRLQGAANRVLAVFEADEDLTVDRADRKSPHRPLSGLNLLFLTLIVSMAVFPMLSVQVDGWAEGVAGPVGAVLLRIVLRLVVLFPLAGILYELLRWGQQRALVLFLARWSSSTPTPAQVEVALAAFRQVLRLEKGIPSPRGQRREVEGEDSLLEDEFEILQLSELGRVRVSAAAFSEEA